MEFPGIIYNASFSCTEISIDVNPNLYLNLGLKEYDCIEPSPTPTSD